MHITWKCICDLRKHIKPLSVLYFKMIGTEDSEMLIFHRDGFCDPTMTKSLLYAEAECRSSKRAMHQKLSRIT